MRYLPEHLFGPDAHRERPNVVLCVAFDIRHVLHQRNHHAKYREECRRSHGLGVS